MNSQPVSWFSSIHLGQDLPIQTLAGFLITGFSVDPESSRPSTYKLVRVAFEHPPRLHPPAPPATALLCFHLTASLLRRAFQHISYRTKLVVTQFPCSISLGLLFIH